MATEPMIPKGAPSRPQTRNEAPNRRTSEPASGIELRTNADRARRRVAEYLRVLGLCDAERIAELSHEIVVQCAPSACGHEQAAVTHAQACVASWRREVFGDDDRAVDSLWLRTFLHAHPEVFLGDPELARAAALGFGNPSLGRAPVHARFVDQSFRPWHLPGWARGLFPSLLASALVVALLLGLLYQSGFSWLSAAWIGLFGCLFLLAAIGLSTALWGCRATLGKPPRKALAHAGPLPRSVLLMPIYHEDVEQVFAAIAAMREDLARVPGGDAFDVFVLSDSREPERAAEEERAFRRVACGGPGSVPLYYRRRAHNERHKAGNLAEFFERWGHAYSYAVVLDADSLMRADTLVALVSRMHASPEVALMQAPLELHRGRTLFARAIQLSSSLCGALFMRGLDRWSGPHGNYYGHNAVLRVRAFLECCSLPALEGSPPLGGHILSHDFVEAALLCRAGWEVRLVPDLHGSYEELPPTLREYIARDRRWCQGNLQHLRIAFSAGLKPMSRLHMLLGTCSYLAAPLWLTLILLGAVLHERAAYPSSIARGATLLTALVLLAPRALGVSLVLRDRKRRRAYGGSVRLVLSSLLELAFSALLAPLLMLHHTRIVCAILLGRSVGWRTQRRNAQDCVRAVVRSELASTLVGALVATLLFLRAPSLSLWLAPAWGPWLLAIPLAWLASSERVGLFLLRHKWLLVPSETDPDALALRAEDLRTLTAPDQTARFRDLVLDPVLLAAHLEKLAREKPERAERELVRRLCDKALRAGPAALTQKERETICADPDHMRLLHREAWRMWPVESWQLAREAPQLPPEAQRTMVRARCMPESNDPGSCSS